MSKGVAITLQGLGLGVPPFCVVALTCCFSWWVQGVYSLSKPPSLGCRAFGLRVQRLGLSRV